MRFFLPVCCSALQGADLCLPHAERLQLTSDQVAFIQPCCSYFNEDMKFKFSFVCSSSFSSLCGSHHFSRIFFFYILSKNTDMSVTTFTTFRICWLITSSWGGSVHAGGGGEGGWWLACVGICLNHCEQIRLISVISASQTWQHWSQSFPLWLPLLCCFSPWTATRHMHRTRRIPRFCVAPFLSSRKHFFFGTTVVHLASIWYTISTICNEKNMLAVSLRSLYDIPVMCIYVCVCCVIWIGGNRCVREHLQRDQPRGCWCIATMGRTLMPWKWSSSPQI